MPKNPGHIDPKMAMEAYQRQMKEMQTELSSYSGLAVPVSAIGMDKEGNIVVVGRGKFDINRQVVKFTVEESIGFVQLVCQVMLAGVQAGKAVAEELERGGTLPGVERPV